MQNKESTTSNNTYDTSIQGYNTCAGKGCNNIGIHNLMIIYINKRGVFCDSCKIELEKLCLVTNQNTLSGDTK